MLAAHGIGPESRDLVMRWNAPLSAVWPYALRDLAVLPLALCLLRSQPWALAAALGLALLLGIIVNTFMLINLSSLCSPPRCCWMPLCQPAIATAVSR
jgi:hypothetical protein